jgi:glycerol kinase
MNIGKKFKLSKNKMLTTVAYKIGDEKMYCYEGSIFVAGSAIQWLRDKLRLFKSSHHTNKLYSKAKKEEKIIIVPALTGLGAPHWEPDVRGGIFGLTRDTSISEIVKATLDSIAYQTFDLVQAMEKDSKIKIKEIRVDGGMISNNNFIQSIANVLRIKIIKPKNIETTALGAAYLAALSSGHLKNLQSIKKIWKIEKNFISNKNKKEVSQNLLNWNKAVKVLISFYKKK